MALDFSKLPDVAKDHPELTADERVHAAHMKAREDAFMAIFGDTEPKDQILSPGEADLTVNWPGGGIHQYAPRPGRSGWHYLTHGLAQPFDFDEPPPQKNGHERISGFGVELVISTPGESQWAPQLLLNFVRYLLFDDDASVFLPGDRIPCAAFSDVESGTKITHLICVKSPEYEHEILLPGGGCTLVHFMGVTSAEIARAKALGPSGPGTEVLFGVFVELGISPVTDLKRKSATDDPRFEKTWTAVKKRLG